MAAVMDRESLACLLATQLPAVDQHGQVVEAVGDDFVRLRLPVGPEHLSADLPPGSGQQVLSGPLLMGFAETSLYACVHAMYGEAVFAFTLSLNASFLRLAGAGELTAVARLLRRGRELAFVEAHLYSGDAQASCAQVTATYAIRALPAPGAGG